MNLDHGDWRGSRWKQHLGARLISARGRSASKRP